MMSARSNFPERKLERMQGDIRIATLAPHADVRRRWSLSTTGNLRSETTSRQRRRAIATLGDCDSQSPADYVRKHPTKLGMAGDDGSQRTVHALQANLAAAALHLDLSAKGP